MKMHCVTGSDRCGGHRGKKSDPLLPESPCETVYSVLPACLPGDRVFVCPSDIEFTRENWHTKGEWIDQVLGEMERCGGQFHKILRELPADSEF